MATQNDHGLMAWPVDTGESVAEHRFVKQASAARAILHADAGEGSSVLGVVQTAPGVLSNNATVKGANEPGTVRIQMSGACALGAKIYVAADGKGTSTPNGAAVLMALEAAAGADSIIEARWLTQAEIGLSGARDTLFVGELDFATSANGDQRTGFLMPFACRIIKFFGMVKEVNVGSGGTILLNLEIAGTNVTGGVLTWSTAEANVLGERLDATAITGTNTAAAGDALDIEGASAGGTRTSGLLELFIEVERL